MKIKQIPAQTHPTPSRLRQSGLSPRNSQANGNAKIGSVEFSELANPRSRCLTA